MTRILFCCLFVTHILHAKAQQNRFIYIQTENKQAFYVKIEKKVYSSAAAGYIIIPQLKDGDYNMAIGFPKNEWPEHTINCKVDKKDAGYMLKNFGEKGWGLFNLQTLEVVMSRTAAKPVVTTENKKDEFSNMLANAVNDSTIRKTEIIKPTAKKDETLPVITNVQNDQPVKAGRSTISRLLYINNNEGAQMIYSVVNNGKADTVRLLIPAVENEKTVVAAIKEEVVKAGADKSDEPKAATSQAASAGKEKFINIELPNTNAGQDTKPDAAKSVTPPVAAPEKAESIGAAPAETKKITMINSNCKNYAVQEDFLKLRKKMAAENNDDDMVAVARKVFKTKCFTVEQVKNLSVLFLKDEGRYKFFDVAYAFVSDSENFSTLRIQLTDEYYISRFNAMIKH